MKERKKNLPADPEFLPAQVAFKAVSDEMLRHKTDDSMTIVNFRIETDPSKLFQRLKKGSLKDMLLKSGDSLSHSNPNERYRDLGLVVGRTPITEVTVSNLNWESKKVRIDPQGPKRPPYKLIRYPGEIDWMREIDINIWFSNGKKSAAQSLMLYDSSIYAGKLPDIASSVYAPDYADTGYEGHNHKSRKFKNEEEVVYFVDLARELFDKRVPETPPAK